MVASIQMASTTRDKGITAMTQARQTTIASVQMYFRGVLEWNEETTDSR